MHCTLLVYAICNYVRLFSIHPCGMVTIFQVRRICHDTNNAKRLLSRRVSYVIRRDKELHKYHKFHRNADFHSATIWSSRHFLRRIRTISYRTKVKLIHTHTHIVCKYIVALNAFYDLRILEYVKWTIPRIIYTAIVDGKQ